MTWLVMYHLNRESQRFVELRRHYLRQRHPHRRAVLVEEIPASLRTHNDIEFYFNALYPGKIEEIIMMRVIPDLETAVAKRDDVLNKLEHKIVEYEKSGSDKLHAQIKELQGILKVKNTRVRDENAKVKAASRKQNTEDSNNEKVALIFGLKTEDEYDRFRRRQSSVNSRPRSSVSKTSPIENELADEVVGSLNESSDDEEGGQEGDESNHFTKILGPGGGIIHVQSNMSLAVI